MDSRLAGAKGLTLAVVWRTVVIAALAFLAFHLLASTHLYATAVLVLVVGGFVATDLAQVVGRIVRSAEHDLERLVANVSDSPAVTGAGPGSHSRSVGAALGGLGGAPSLGPGQSARPFDQAAAILNAARTERQEQLEYVHTLLDTVSAALIVVEPDGRVTFANRAARALSAGPVRRLEDVPAIGDPAARALLALRPGAREIVSTADGQRMFASVSHFTIPGREARRLIALQRIAGDLDAVELKAWQDMAHVLAHEMMNSLTPIASLSESLEALLKAAERAGPEGVTRANEEVLTALEAIKRRSLGLMDFVERYRAVAELPRPRPQRVQMHGLVRAVGRLMDAKLDRNRIDYRISVEPEDLCADADPQLLEQALINLLRNAADAAASVEQPRIEVSCLAREDRVAIEISDNGLGVPDDQRDQIFVPFFTTKAGGSGIGLNLARQIALSHGGRLELRANHPRGCVFTLLLPAAQPPDKAAGPASPESAADRDARIAVAASSDPE